MLVASQNPPFARTSRFDSELRHHNNIKDLMVFNDPGSPFSFSEKTIFYRSFTAFRIKPHLHQVQT